MDAERLRQIEQLLHAALEIEKNRRAEFLREACGADESLRHEVESLLAYASKAETFIEEPALELVARGLAQDEVPRLPTTEEVIMECNSGPGTARWLPARIGRYRILRVLGEGGMGVVYEGEQEEPRRTVALKVIKPGLASPELLRRFEQESRALARLQHPAIAQIHEAGTADAGFGPQPFFAMERIRGHSLLDYAEEHGLNARQRLELMVKICEGIQHAHQRGLIHRDLKPGNILVDEIGQPKILDFGVVRVTDSDAQTTRQTDLGQLVGTLAYMSPEQVFADPPDLDTRSDVYALGVILYELLAGRLPYNLSRKPHEAARTIREVDPTPLSSISRLYRGDIETIAAKALEKDRDRRYGWAADLAADIQRYLKDEPIAARPASASYQLRKFARRNRGLVAGVAAVFVVLVGGVIASMWQATRATRERDRATAAEQRASRERDRAVSAELAANAAETRARQERNSAVAAKQRADTEAAMAKAVNDFLQNDLLAQAGATAQASRGSNLDPDLKVRTALDRAAARIEGRFKTQPLVEASILQTIGKTYEDLGLYPEAQRNVERALALRLRVLGAKHRDTLISMNQLASLYLPQGKYAQAEPLLGELLEARRLLLGAAHPETLETMHTLAQLYHYQGKYALAETFYTRTLEGRRRVRGPEHYETLGTTNDLAVLYRDAGKYALAEPLSINVLEVGRRVLGDDHPLTLICMNNLAVLYLVQRKYAEAEPLVTKIVDIRRRLLGDQHPNTLTGMNNLAVLYSALGKYEQAEPLFINVVEARRHVLGDEHPSTLQTMFLLAGLYRKQGKYAQAELQITKVLEVRRRVLGEEHPQTLVTMEELAVLHGNQARYAQAETLAKRVVEVQRRVMGGEHPDTLHTMTSLALLYRDQGEHQQAEVLYSQVLEARRRVLGSQHPDTTSVLVSLAGLRLQQQRYGDAEPLLREALTSYEKSAPEGWRRYDGQSMLGASLAGQKRFGEAEALLLSGYHGMLQREATIPAFERIELDQAGKWIIQLYQDWGKPEQAAECREKLQPGKILASPVRP
jgi:hypothetical protein